VIDALVMFLVSREWMQGVPSGLGRAVDVSEGSERRCRVEHRTHGLEAILVEAHVADK